MPCARQGYEGRERYDVSERCPLCSLGASSRARSYLLLSGSLSIPTKPDRVKRGSSSQAINLILSHSGFPSIPTLETILTVRGGCVLPIMLGKVVLDARPFLPSLAESSTIVTLAPYQEKSPRCHGISLQLVKYPEKPIRIRDRPRVARCNAI
jgi:hypothetical protein